MFIEFKTVDGNITFLLNAFQIVSVHETTGGNTAIYTVRNETFKTSEKYKDVVEKLSAI